MRVFGEKNVKYKGEFNLCHWLLPTLINNNLYFDADVWYSLMSDVYF